MIQRAFIGSIVILSSFFLLSCSKDKPAASTPPVTGGPGEVDGGTYSSDDLLVFKQMALYGSALRIINRWPKKVSYYIVDTQYDYLTEEVDAVLKEINALLDTNLVLTRTNVRSESNIQIFFTDRNTYLMAEPDAAPTLYNSTYGGLSYLRQQEGILTTGSVFVDMDRAKDNIPAQRYLVYHEIMHSLGFRGHASLTGTYTVLFYYTLIPYILSYTPFDKRMIQLLYHPQIKLGMNEEQVDKIVKAL